MKEIVDELDKELICALADEGRTSTAEVAERLSVSAPTVRSRLRALIEGGRFAVAGLIDAFAFKGLTMALVGLTLKEYTLDEKVEQLAALDDVNWAAVVTGRYDIIVEVVTSEGMSGLYDFLNVSLQDVGGIQSSEMFVVMKAKNKWIRLPRRLRAEWSGAEGRHR
jgi:Lrp/AsnC family transcriptional regulator for asnA, asnC and gidA